MPSFLENMTGPGGWAFFDAPRISKTLSGHRWLSVWGVLKMSDSMLRGVAQVVFVNNPLSGLLMLIGIFLADVLTGLGTVFCTAIAFFVAKMLLDLPDAQLGAGLPLFSPVLVGSVTVSLFTPFFHAPITPPVWAYMAFAAALSVCVFAGLGHILAPHNLPAYTLPFNVATSLMFLGLRGAGYAFTLTKDLAASDFPAILDASAGDNLDNLTLMVPDDSLELHWGKVWLGALLSAGQVWAVESVVCSVLILIAMFLCSPLLTVACFVGGSVGTLTALVVSQPPYGLVYAGVWGYNGFLAAGAMAFFMVSNPRVLILSVINAVLATFIQAALIPVFAQNNLPVFTFPFCLASLLFLAATSSSSSSFHRVVSPSFPEMHILKHRQESLNEQRQEEKEETVTAHMV